MTNTWVHGVEVNFCNSASVLAAGCLQQSACKKGTPSPELVADSVNGQRGDGPLISLGDHVSLAHKLATWEPDCDGVSDEGSYPSVASSGSTDTDAGEWGFSEESDHCRGHGVDVGGSVTSFDTGSFESCDVAEDAGPLAGSKVAPCADGLVAADKLSYVLDLQQDGGGEFFDSEDSPAWARPLGKQCSPSTPPLKPLHVPQGCAYVDKQLLSLAVCKDPSRFISQEMGLYCSEDLVSSARCPGPPLRGTGEYACETGESPLITHLGSGEVVSIAETNGTSSSYASVLQPNDHTVRPRRRGDADVGFRDLEAGFEPGSLLLSREQGDSQDKTILGKDVLADFLTSGSLVSHSNGHQFPKILLSHIPEHELSLSKDISYRADGRSTNGHAVEREDGELSSLRRRRGSRVEGHTCTSALVAEGTRLSQQDSVIENGHEVRKVEKKCAKQLKARLASVEKEVASMASVKAGAGLRRSSGDALSAEELRAKEQADNDRKVQESLDNFIRQTMGREPYMSFASRPSDRPLPRRSILPFKTASEIRDTGADDNLGGAVDSESLRDASGDSVRAGVARSLPLSGDRMNPFKVLQALVAFAQAAGKADPLPGWPFASNIKLQKCSKVQCSREFISEINLRRHNRSHKKTFDSDKEDWNKSRLDIANFWQTKSPRQRFHLFQSVFAKGSSSEDYSVTKVVEALSKQQISLPLSYQNSGADLVSMVQSQRKEVNWDAEKLFGTFDSASEKTFLVGSTDPTNNKVFSGDEKAVGMEVKNLVSFLAFILEGALLKEWIANRNTESLKRSNALLAEEEAFRRKQEEGLERRRLRRERKLQERGRKESSSALMSADAESHLQDTQSVVDGDAQEDSPRSASPSQVWPDVEPQSRVLGGGRAPLESAVVVTEPDSLDIPSNVEGGGAQEDMARSLPLSVASVERFEELGGHFDSREVDSSVLPPGGPDLITADVQGASQASSLEPTGLASGLSQETPLSRPSPMQLSSDAVEDKSVTTAVQALSRAQESGFVGGDELGTSSPAGPSKQGKRAEGGPEIGKLEQEKPVSDVRRPEADRNVPDKKPQWMKQRTEIFEGISRPSRGIEGKSSEVPVQSASRQSRKFNYAVPHPAKAEAVPHVPSSESDLPRPQGFRTVSPKVKPPSPAGNVVVWAPKSVHSVSSDAKETQVSEAGIKDDAELKGFSGLQSDELKERFAGRKPVVISGPTSAPLRREVVPSINKVVSSAGPAEAIPAMPIASSLSASFDFDLEFPPITDQRKSASLHVRKTVRTEGSIQPAVDAQHPLVSSGQLLVGSVPIELTDSGAREVTAGEISRSLHSGYQDATRISSSSRTNTRSRSTENPTAGETQVPSGQWKGPVAGNASVPSRPNASILDEQGDTRPTGSDATGVATSVAPSIEEPQPRAPERLRVDRGPVLKGIDREREYVKMLQDFNRLRWEEANREEGCLRDVEAANPEVPSPSTKNFGKQVWDVRQSWLTGAGGQTSTRGSGSDDANEQASHGAGRSGDVDRVGSCDDDRPTLHSQQVSQDNVDTNLGSTGNEGDSRRGGNCGLDRRGEHSRGGSSGGVSGGVQGRKVYRMQAPFKYIPRRRVEGPVARPDKT